ncbi:MAG: serine hydroxymethyltransferase [Candidatus Pacebacteria bacterium]|nr:serine hydroxymethyltransferase [Candidatus Paceibacterota bacterium]
MNYNNLQKIDSEVLDIISKETKRQEDELELIASENYVSSAVLEALASPLANKYSEGYSGKRYYGGNKIIDEVEDLAISRAKELFQAEHVNVQSLSGSPANFAVYNAFLEPGDKVLAFRLDHGGHLTHGHSVNFSGKLYNFVHYGVGADGYIDMEALKKQAMEEKPKMIVAGFSAYSRNLNWQKFREVADEIGAILFADISHIAGLIAAKKIENPVPICDVVSTTTHKTLRGPRGAIILCKEKFAKDIDRSVFPGMQGGPHDNMTAAKAVAFKEAMTEEFVLYTEQVMKNASFMAQEFLDLGYNIVSAGTDNHMFVLDLSSLDIGGKEAEKSLESIGISVSRSTIPNDPRPPYNPSGLRIGTPAITTRGMKEGEVKEIVKIIDLTLKNTEDLAVLETAKKRVADLCKKFPLNY